ncbi:ABC-three component system protein [Actinoallomurus sp. NPDC052274]|uniref:ABC-three component system protein n=1 Tax=Actinoallomurus sp. NPDC052274 TaxID=3155420 RepID=UPI0034441A2E
MLNAKLDELHGQEFEDFFYDLMCARYPSFLDVRTHGNLGDRGSDGLLLSDGKLYACNGPQAVNPSRLKSKIATDVRKAIALRGGEFKTFVFVHNDRRGMLPAVSSALADARNAYPRLSFENFGHRSFYNELCRLERWQVEDLLGPFPAQPVVTGVVLADLIPLLDHLATYRQPVDEPPKVPRPSAEKMDYNNFSPDTKYRMRGALCYVHHVEAYYANRLDPNERDEVAKGFKAHYEIVAGIYEDPDDVLAELERHILGNAAQSPATALNALVILMYFFGECEIFKVPPDGWAPTTQMGVIT